MDHGIHRFRASALYQFFQAAPMFMLIDEFLVRSLNAE